MSDTLKLTENWMAPASTSRVGGMLAKWRWQMLGLKSKPLTEAQIRAKLETLEPRIVAAGVARQTAADAVVNGDNPDVYDAACAEEARLKSERDRLQDALPIAVKREAEEAARLATEEEQRLAGAKKRADEALYRGAQTDLGNFRRAMRPISAACDVIAEAVAAANSSASNFVSKMPDGAPYDEVFWHFDSRMIGAFVADELARAGAATGVELPGGGQVPDGKFEAELRAVTDHVANFARRVIIEGARHVEPPVIGQSSPAPKKEPETHVRYPRQEIERQTRIMQGLDPDGPDEKWFALTTAPKAVVGPSSDDPSHQQYAGPNGLPRPAQVPAAVAAAPSPELSSVAAAPLPLVAPEPEIDAAAEMRAQSAMLRAELGQRDAPPPSLVTDKSPKAVAADTLSGASVTPAGEAGAPPVSAATAPTDTDAE